MSVTASGPDGSTFSFPDGTPQEVVRSTLGKHYGWPRCAACELPQECRDLRSKGQTAIFTTSRPPTWRRPLRRSTVSDKRRHQRPTRPRLLATSIIVGLPAWPTICARSPMARRLGLHRVSRRRPKPPRESAATSATIPAISREGRTQSGHTRKLTRFLAA